MKKEFLPYELALRMKALGFDEPCWAWWHIKDCDTRFCYSEERSPIINSGETEVIGLPTFSQAFDWFRTEHKMKFHIHEDQSNHWCTPKILIPETCDYEEICDSYETFREAELASLRKLIEIIESKSE